MPRAGSCRERFRPGRSGGGRHRRPNAEELEGQPYEGRPEKGAEREVQDDHGLVLVEPYVEGADEDLRDQKRSGNPRVAQDSRAHAAALRHRDQADDQDGGEVHEYAVRQVDVDETGLTEGQEVPVAGGELLAAGVVCAIADLI